MKTISFFFKFFPTVLQANLKDLRSGVKFFFTGVGTVIMKKLAFFNASDLLVIFDLL